MSQNGTERSGPCDRCYSTDDLIAVTTVVNGIEQKEWVCSDCELEAREDEKPPLRADGGSVEDGTERVVFAERYDEMPEKLEVLVGDSGFIVPASKMIQFQDRVLVQFDENKTGRAGGERHWIPERCLESVDGGGRDV